MKTTFVRRTATALALALAGCIGASDPEIPLAPSDGQRSFFETEVAAPGWLPRFGDLVRLDASTHRGSVVGSASVAPFSWSTEGNDVLIAYDAPRTIWFDYLSIRDSPAPVEVQDAYVLHYGDVVTVQVDVLASRFHATAHAGDTFRIEDTQTQRLTWGPFDLNGQTYVYSSGRTQKSAMQLRERAPAPAVPWTAGLATATWALDTYYAPPGTSYLTLEPQPSEYNGDLLALEPQGAGASRLSGRTLSWTIAAGRLEVLYSDGSSEEIEIVDGGPDVYGLWSEHRDASGALVGGRYDWAFRAETPPAATVAAFATGPTQHWQQMVSGWMAEAWDGTRLRWDWTFGWELLADGTGNNVQAWYDTGPNGAPIPNYDLLPLTWYVTDTGLLRIDRLTFPTGENRGYRLLTPMGISADGAHAFVLEEDYRRLWEDPAGPYYVMIAPRLTMYERRAIPPSTPP